MRAKRINILNKIKIKMGNCCLKEFTVEIKGKQQIIVKMIPDPDDVFKA